MTTVQTPAPAAAPEPEPAPVPVAEDKKMWSVWEKIFEYFERLGIATAVGAGGMAVIFFRHKLFPGFGIFPGLIGLLLILAAFFLLVFTAAATV